MPSKAVCQGTARRIMKLHGTVVGVDLVHGVIMIQTADHAEKKVRYVSVGAGADIHAGPDPLTLADVFVGDRVRAHCLREKEHEVLITLHLPRTMTSGGHPARPKASEPHGAIGEDRSAKGGT